MSVKSKAAAAAKDRVENEKASEQRRVEAVDKSAKIREMFEADRAALARRYGAVTNLS